MAARSVAAAALLSATLVAAQPQPLSVWTRVNITSQGLVNGLPMPRCIDGSDPAYYFKPGVGVNASKWILFFEGGGWCTSPESCLERSKGELGSSVTYNITSTAWGARDLLLPNCDVNPEWCTWTTVYQRYCDGQSRAGSAWLPEEVDGKPLYYRGLSTLLHMLAQLLEPYTTLSLANATHLLISGSSAGGLTTYLHADLIADTVKQVNPSIVVKAVPEVGFFIDGASIWGGEHLMTAAYFRAQTFANISAPNSVAYNVNAECVAAATNHYDREKCFMAQYAYPHIATPVFIVNSKYDEWQLSNILAPNPNTTFDVSPYAPWQPCISAPSTGCNASQYAQFQGYADQFMAALNASRAAMPPDRAANAGGFITSCDIHTTMVGGISHKIFVDGKLMYEAVADWFWGRNECASGSCWWIDGAWPNNPTCVGPHIDAWRGFEM